MRPKALSEIPSIFSYCSGLSDIQTKGGERAKVIEVAPVDLARVEIPAPSIATQRKVVDVLDRFDTLTKSLTDGIPAEIGVRRAQYGYYRDRLLDLPRKTIGTE